MVATERRLRCDTPRDLAARATDRSVRGKGTARRDLRVKEENEPSSSPWVPNRQRIARTRGCASRRSLPLLEFVCGVPGGRHRMGESVIGTDGRIIPDTAPLDRDSEGQGDAVHGAGGTLAEGEYPVVGNGRADGCDSRRFGVIPAGRIPDRMVIVHLFGDGDPSPPFASVRSKGDGGSSTSHGVLNSPALRGGRQMGIAA